jgi:glycosyltransferase involved in cell wall biosynthesis
MFDTGHYLRQLEQLVTKYDLNERVHFLGFRSDIAEILRAIDVFVHPSIEADSPVSIQEAMATGRPVIASAVPGTVELINDEIDGYLVPPNNSAVLAEKLALLLNNSSDRQRIAFAARQTAEHRFDQQVFLHNFETILDEAVRS